MTSAALRKQYASLFSLLGVLKEHPFMFWISVVLGICNQLFGIGVAATSSLLVGMVATGSTWSQLSPVIWALFALVIISALLAWLEMWLVHDMAYRVLASLRIRLFRALERLAPAYFVERRIGDFTATAMSDVETLEWFYAHTVGAFMVIAAVSGTVLAALGWLHPTLALVLTPLVIALLIVPTVFAHKAAKQGEAMRRELATVNAQTIEAVQAVRDLAIFDADDTQLARLNQQSQRLIGVQVKHGMRDGIEHAISSAISGAGVLIVLIVAAGLVADGKLDPAYYPVVTILSSAVFLPVMTISRIAANMGNMSAAADRVNQVLTAQPLVADDATSAPTENVHALLTFDNVSFSYPGADRQALKHVSFHIQPGETVALVGHSGAGKSTCAHLAQRFWDTAAGRVLLDGHDVCTFPSKDLNRHITLLSQVTDLFQTSIAENIRLAKPDSSDAEVEAAAKKAMAHDFITQLPHGYQTHAGERGLQLSGGQRQRIALARAFLADSPILVMDEALAHLDSQNEAQLHAALKTYRKANQATLIIAHRLSTIRACDRILVLEDGALVEQGTHEALLEKRGTYAALIRAQEESET